MTRYHVQSRGFLVLICGAAAGAALLTFLVVIRPALTGASPPAENPGRLIIGPIFGAIFLIAFLMQMRSIHTIQVNTDLSIHLVRPLGRDIIFSAQDVWEFEGGYGKDYDGNYTVWNFTMRCSAGTFKFGEFDGVMNFVDWVVAFNPKVAITGMRPLSSRYGPRPSGITE